MDLLPLLTVGSPVGVAAFIIGFLAKQYFEKKKDDREDTSSARQSETQIVETTKSAIKMVRDELETMGITLLEEREEHKKTKQALRAETQKRNAAEDQVDALTDENRTLRRKLSMLEGSDGY